MKSLVLATDEHNEAGDIVKVTVWLLLVRGDHNLNEIKTGKLQGLKGGFRFATVPEIELHFGCQPGTWTGGTLGLGGEIGGTLTVGSGAELVKSGSGTGSIRDYTLATTGTGRVKLVEGAIDARNGSITTPAIDNRGVFEFAGDASVLDASVAFFSNNGGSVIKSAATR